MASQEDLQRLVNSINAQMAQMGQKNQEQEEKMNWMNNQFQEMWKKVASHDGQLESAKNSNSKQRDIVDSRNVQPGHFQGNGGGPTFREWSDDMKVLVIDFSGGKLHKAIVATEHGKTEVTTQQVQEQGLTDRDHHQLMKALYVWTRGPAKVIVKKCAECNLHALEAWRLLTSEYDPRTMQIGVQEMIHLCRPPQAKQLQGMSDLMNAWERAIHQKIRVTGVEPLPDEPRRECW